MSSTHHFYGAPESSIVDPTVCKHISLVCMDLCLLDRALLHFDGFTSDWIDIHNGIGQGDPLSMMLYDIYSVDMANIAQPRRVHKALKQLTLAFLDGMALVTTSKDFVETHWNLEDMLECLGGGLNWSQKHNSLLLDFSMNRKCERPQ